MTKTGDKPFRSALTFIVFCLVSVLVLTLANNLTAPIIDRQKPVPGPDAGISIDSELLPPGVDEAILNADGTLTVRASARGFSGPVEFIVKMDSSGNYISIKMGANNETPGIGSNVGDAEYVEKFYGSRDPGSVDALSGATRTSKALKAVLALCNQVFDAVGGQ